LEETWRPPGARMRVKEAYPSKPNHKLQRLHSHVSDVGERWIVQTAPGVEKGRSPEGYPAQSVLDETWSASGPLALVVGMGYQLCSKRARTQEGAARDAPAIRARIMRSPFSPGRTIAHQACPRESDGCRASSTSPPCSLGLFEEPLETLPSALCLPFSLLLAVVILCFGCFGT
jgi:hypothetical protein